MTHKTKLREADSGSSVPRLLLTAGDAAKALGMSVSHFKRHVQARIPVVYSGQLRLYAVRDLEHWVEQERTLGGRALESDDGGRS